MRTTFTADPLTNEEKGQYNALYDSYLNGGQVFNNDEYRAFRESIARDPEAGANLIRDTIGFRDGMDPAVSQRRNYLTNKGETAKASPSVQVPNYVQPESINGPGTGFGTGNFAGGTNWKYSKDNKYKGEQLLSEEEAAGQTQSTTTTKQEEPKKPNYGTAGGNIDLNDRPTVANSNFTYSTVDSFSTNIDGKEVLLPTVIKENGKWKHVSEEEALEHYYKTGEKLGVFNTPEEANAYAEALHNNQAEQYGSNAPKFLGQKDKLPDISNLSQLSLQQGAQKVGEQELVPGRADQLGYRATNTITGAGKQIGSQITSFVGTLAKNAGETMSNGTTNNLIWRQNGEGNPNSLNARMAPSVDKFGSTVQATAEELGKSAQADIDQAKNGLSKFGQAGVDIATNVIQMGFDAAVGAVTGGASLASMFVRSAGGAMQKARSEGADTTQQTAYGLATGAIEVITEKLADGVAKIYGGGAADDIAEKLVRKFAKTDTGRTALRALYGMVSEGGEEVISDLLAPYAELLYNEKSFSDTVKNTFKGTYDPSELLYDFVIGFTIGGLGQGASIATGQSAQANAELRAIDTIQNNLVANGMDASKAGRAANILSEVAKGETISQRDSKFLDSVGGYNTSAPQASNPIVQNSTTSQPTVTGRNGRTYEGVGQKAQNPERAAQNPANATDAGGYKEGDSEYRGYQITVEKGNYLNGLRTTYRITSPDGRFVGYVPISSKASAQITEQVNNDISLHAEEQQAETATPTTEQKTITPADARKVYDDINLDYGWVNTEQITEKIKSKTTAELEAVLNLTIESDPNEEDNINRLRAQDKADIDDLIREELQRRQAETPAPATPSTETQQVQQVSIDEQITQAEDELQQAQQAYDAAQNDPEMQAPLLEAVEQAQERLDNLRNQKASAEQLTNSETSSTETTQAPTENKAPQENPAPQQTNAERIAELEEMLQNETDPMRRGMLQSEIDRLQKENTFNTGDNSSGSNNHSNGETWSGPEVQTQSTVHDQLTDAEKERADLNPENDTHVQHHDTEVDNYAQNRITERGHEGAREDLMSRDPAEWDDVDVRTAQMIIREELAHARALTGEEQDAAYRRIAELKNAYNKQGTEAGRTLRQRQRFGGTMEDIISEAAAILYGEENQKNLKKMKPEQKSELMRTIEDYAQRRENRQAGDTASLIEMIKELNEQRRTAGLFNKKTSAPMSFFLEQAAKQDGGEEFLNNILGQQIRGLANDKVKTSFGDVMSTLRFNNMLSNLVTIVRNFTANPVMDLSEAISTDLGVLFDVAMSKFTGTRSIAWDSGWFSAAKRAGTADAFVRSVIEEGLDAPLESSGKYEETRQGRTFKMSGGFVERVLSTWSKYLNYGLKTTDEMMKGGIRESTQAGLDRLTDRGKISEKGQGELEGRADYVAKERTLQKEDGYAAKALTGTRKAFGWAGEQLMPFALVPANATTMSINYTPAGVLSTLLEVGKAINTVKNGGTVTADQQAKIVTSLGRNVNATALIGLSFVLAMKGIIKTAQDDDKDKAALEKSEGLNGTQLNLSALGRFLSGEDTEAQEGDQLLGLGFLEYLNASMAMGAALAEDYQDKGKITAKDIAIDNLGAVLDSVLSLPAVSQISSAVDAYNYSKADTTGGKLADAAVAMGGSIASGYVVPNWLRGVAKGADQYERVTYTGDNLQNNINYLKSGIPGLRETLPIKVDPLGKEVKRGDNPLVNFLNATVLPGELKEYTPHKVTAELDKIAEATGRSVYPDRNAPKTIKSGDESYTLSTEEQTKYLKVAGDKTNEYLSALFKTPYYEQMSDDLKAEAITEMESLAQDYAKEQYLSGKGGSYSSDRTNLLLGSNKPGDSYDKVALNPSNLVNYVSFKLGYDDAVKHGDYTAIDYYVSQYSKMSKNIKTVAGERITDLENLAEYRAQGMDAASFYEVKSSRSKAQYDLDESASTSASVRLLGLSYANIPESEKAKIINNIADYIGSNGKAAYNALSKYGIDTAGAYDFFNTALNCKTWKNTGEPVDAKGKLSADATAYALSQMPNLTDEQRVAVYNDIKKEVSNYYNDWGNYTYDSEIAYIKRSTNKASYSVPNRYITAGADNPLYNGLPQTKAQTSENYNALLRAMGIG